MSVHNTPNDGRRRSLRRFVFGGLLTCASLGLNAAPALSAISCKPLLAIKNVREIRTSSMPQPWTWQATITADASSASKGNRPDSAKYPTTPSE